MLHVHVHVHVTDKNVFTVSGYMTLHHDRLDKVKITNYQVLGLLTQGLKL